MTKQVILGLKAEVLAEYMAAVGLASVVCRQADESATFGWSGASFWIETEVDIVDFLLRQYQPAPIMSPWNGGSGFQPKDRIQRLVLDRLASTQSERLAVFRQALQAVERVMAEAEVRSWDKERTALELRNSLPDAALDWLDAAVVLPANGKAAFPPLLGTGGNDGRLEFSAKFHERLCDVLPEAGADQRRSRGWLDDMVRATALTPLASAPVGMFDGMRAGGVGSSKFGDSDSRVNPWIFVLMMEGLAQFSSGISRRSGRSAGRAAMPFTLPAGADPATGAEGRDTSRGEFWAPLVESSSWPSFARTVAQSRASWDAGRVRSPAQMYAAVKSYGVDRGISAFERFVFSQANGLAYVAILLDVVEVNQEVGASLARVPLRRLEALRAASGQAASEQVRRLETAIMRFVREPSADRLLLMLEDLTRAETVCRTSQANRDLVPAARELVSGEELTRFLENDLAKSPELRLAAALASAVVPLPAFWAGQANEGEVLGTSLRQLLMGDGAADAVVKGLLTSPLHRTLAELAVWVAVHGASPGSRPAQQGPPSHGIQLVTRHRQPCSWTDSQRWIAGSLDEGRLKGAFLGFLAADWRGRTGASSDKPTIAHGYIPVLALLQAFAQGRVNRAASTSRSDAVQGLDPSWPTRLRAGHVPGVSKEAYRLAARSVAWRPGPSGPVKSALAPALPPSTICCSGERLLAALFAPGPSRAEVHKYFAKSVINQPEEHPSTLEGELP